MLMLGRGAAQLTSGLVLGLSAVIYAVSYAALMFSGPLAAFMPWALSVTLVTAAVGGLYGFFSEEPTLVNGPDSNTSSVLAGMLAAAVAGGAQDGGTLNRALAVLLCASLFAAACYLLIERFGLARLVRYIPFQTTAGFLASTGWLMASGGLNVIAGTPLTLDGLAAWLEQPWQPALWVGLGLALVLALMRRVWRPAVAIPVFVVLASVAMNLVLRLGCAGAAACAPALWFFEPFTQLHWHAPWDLRFDGALLADMLRLLPSFFAVAFVGTLTMLLSLSSLELAYGRDFSLEQALRLHGRTTLVSTALGGYLGVLSIGRSTLCRSTGGGRWTGWIASAVCVGVLLGLGGVLAWVPRAVPGALVLVIGLGMLKQWLWDQRKTLPLTEWLEVLAIVLCVVVFGYVVGFLAGLLAACIFFVVNYSRMPFIAMDATLAQVRSSVVRSAADQAWLGEAGERCRIGRFEGFVFFGVASAIYDWYRAGDAQRQPLVLMDFSRVRRIDPSAAAVLQKVIRAHGAKADLLLIVPGKALGSARLDPSPVMELLPDFDAALERAEELLLSGAPEVDEGGRRWLGEGASAQDEAAFQACLVPQQLAAGATLFEEGQASDEMYFVRRGGLDVVKATAGGRLRLAQVRAGSMLGEMALYTGQVRSASAVASEDCELLVLTRAARERLQREHPQVAALLDRQVVTGLAGAIQRANALLKLQAG